MSEKLKNIKRIDNWFVKEYLGEGAYAYVYEVENEKFLQEKLNNKYASAEPVVLKWMLPNPGDRDALKRFANEASILKKLDHPSIPKFHGEGVYKDRPYIVMAKAPGRILRKILEERQKEGTAATLGDLRVLAILKKILEVLKYLHRQNVHHRDLKDDNILSNESDTQLTIIDFGVCEAKSLPEDVLTFRGFKGSARFSPPSKIRSEESKEVHDIFAVGVIGYLLLTGKYPWEVASNKNAEALANLMQSKSPESILELNPRVSPDISNFIFDLLNTSDENRPNASESLKTINEIEKKIAENVTEKRVIKAGKIINPHVTLDPVHRDIRLTDFEWKLINSKEFQRLRLIRQLGFTSLVFYGADHSRFSHAIGTMHVTNKILNAIEERGEGQFTIEEKLAVRCYALVHDIAHIAFGHTLEDELNFFSRHDENSSRLSKLVFSDKSDLGLYLRSTEYGREILKYLDTKKFSSSNQWIGEMIESSFGADVIDYINRDAFHCGLDHSVDSAIYRRVSVKQHSKANQKDRHYLSELYGQHGHRIDAEFAIESILRERYALFMKVYTHPVKIAASTMLGKGLTELLNGAKTNKSLLNELEWIGDTGLVKLLSESSNPFVRRFGQMILNRRLYKPIYRAKLVRNIQDNDLLLTYETQKNIQEKKGLFDPNERRSIEASLAKSSKLKAEDIIVYCSRQAPGIKKIRHYVEKKPGQTSSIDDASPIHLDYMRKHLGLWFIYVFVNPSINDDRIKKLAAASEVFFSIKNDIETPLRELQMHLPFE